MPGPEGVVNAAQLVHSYVRFFSGAFSEPWR